MEKWLLLPVILLSSVSYSQVSTQDEEASPSYDVIIGGQNTNVSIGVNGNFPFSGYLNASAGIATASIGSTNILDLKVGIGTLEPKQTLTSVWSHLFVGQSQILTEDVIGLGKGDTRYWFLEGFVGLGPIGVGYRFNFMDDEDGIYIRKTHIPRNLMFPFIAITSRQ
ncbi:MAG: hypothetical protein EOP04_27480 [Proteobacteria bacterium]|nr:MAG: hypothetical protein EOP04_27480 [Pseudomonadota bacterium]